MNGKWWLALALSAAAVGCSNGKDGKAGQDGAAGAQGPQGPAGPAGQVTVALPDGGQLVVDGGSIEVIGAAGASGANGVVVVDLADGGQVIIDGGSVVVSGSPGPAGSPDAPQDVLAKLEQVDGADSGLDADTLDGLGAAAFQRAITGSCETGHVAGVNPDGSLVCTADAVSSYGAGAGLLLSGTTFSLDPAAIPAPVHVACGSGEYLQAVFADGGALCATDQSGSVTAGPGILVSGGTVSADTAVVQARIAAGCPAGSAIREVDADGGVVCGPFTSTYLVPNTGDAGADGQALLQAVARAVGPALIKVEPGTYDLGGASLSLRSGVDLEGSGERNTKIVANTDGVSSGGVIAQGNNAVRNLSFSNASGSTWAVGVSIGAGVSNVTLDHVTFDFDETFGMVVRSSGTNVVLDHFTSTMTQSTSGLCYAVDEEAGSLEVRDSSFTVNASGNPSANGISSANGEDALLTVVRSTVSITGGDNQSTGIGVNGRPGGLLRDDTVSVASSGRSQALLTINGPVAIEGGSATATSTNGAAVGVFALSPSTVVRRLAVSASGSTESDGLEFFSGGTSLDCDVSAAGGTSYGVFAGGPSTVIGGRVSTGSATAGATLYALATTVHAVNVFLDGLAVSPQGSPNLTCSNVTRASGGTFTAGSSSCP